MSERTGSHPEQQAIYADNPRTDVIPSIPRDARSVLDVGCGKGGFGRSLREALGADARVVGVEATRQQAAIAREGHGFDEVLEGYFPDVFTGREERFDAIFFNDVLEHIVDPWQVLRECHRFLNPGGVVVAAIPNVQYLPVVIDLFRGRWEYVDDGILDRTHVRFFTKSSMTKMFEETGYTVEESRGANGLGGRFTTDPVRWRRTLKLGVIGLAGDRQFLHFVVTGRPTP